MKKRIIISLIIKGLSLVQLILLNYGIQQHADNRYPYQQISGMEHTPLANAATTQNGAARSVNLTE